MIRDNNKCRHNSLLMSLLLASGLRSPNFYCSDYELKLLANDKGQIQYRDAPFYQKRNCDFSLLQIK